MGWGTIGAGNGDGEGKRREVGVSLQATWDQSEWTGIASHAKEGFQVSKRDSGTGEGSSGRRGIIKGILQGVIKGFVPCNVNPAYIVLL